MKILTVLFLIYYIYLLFNQGGFIKKSMIKTLQLLPQDYKASEKDTYDFSKLEYNDPEAKTKEITTQFIKFIFAMIFAIILAIMEFIYIIKATSFGGNIAIMYLIFWILIFLKSIIKSKRNKKDNKDITMGESLSKFNKFKFSKLLINFVDVAYFGYMFYVLFL